MKKGIALALALVLACTLTACGGGDGSYARNQAQIVQMEQTDRNSIISGIRTGIVNQFLSTGSNEFECTDDGVYFLAKDIPGEYQYGEEGVRTEGSYCFLFFCPHDSDQMIKLCGRSDCPHDTMDCNAAFPEAYGGVSYYDEHLYITLFSGGPELLELYRVNPDGSDRVKVMDCGSVSEGYSTFGGVYVTNGYFLFYLVKVNDETGERIMDPYYYKLDGSMRKPKLAKGLKQAGTNISASIGGMDVFLTDTSVDPDGNTSGHNYRIAWDPETDTVTYLMDRTGYGYGYWGLEEAYLLVEGAVVRLNYADGGKEVLFDTGLQGNLFPRFYPDCIVIFDETAADAPVMYFYDWQGNRLGELSADFPNCSHAAALTGGETRDRILLRTGSCALPEYYIEKSDFGTGTIELHRFRYPDLPRETLDFLFGTQGGE